MRVENVLSDILTIRKYISRNQIDEAKKRSFLYVKNEANQISNNEELLAHIFAQSLLMKITSRKVDTESLFPDKLKRIKVDLFKILAKAFPYVLSSHDIANQFLIDAMHDLDQETITIFNIGSGKGIQLRKLFDRIKHERSNIKKINIIGLDPDKDKLNDFGKLINELNDKMPFEVTTHLLHNFIEELTDSEYSFIRDIGDDALFINSAFHLHHTTCLNDIEQTRIRIFKHLYDLKPKMFTLIEPHSNHVTQNFNERLTNAWNHYKTIFDVIDKANIDEDYKFYIKKIFFGHEIKDIIANDELYRIERHELTEGWIRKLDSAGFVPGTNDNIQIELPEYCSYTTSNGYVSLGYKDINIVSVFGYRS